MKYSVIKPIADKYVELLRPMAKRIEIAGSIRRKCAYCNDIEIIMVRDNSKLFGLKDLVDSWYRIKGDVAGKYCARILPEKVQLDLFFATPDNWGMIYLIRTGSVEFIKGIAWKWAQQGYQSKDGLLHPIIASCCEGELGDPIPLREERDVFEFLKIPWVEPKGRK